MKAKLSYEELARKLKELESQLNSIINKSSGNLSVFKQIIENSKESICICDQNGNILYNNESFRSLFFNNGKNNKEVIFFNMLTKQSVSILKKKIFPDLPKINRWEGLLHAYNTKGQSFPIKLLVEHVKGSINEKTYCTCFMHDYSSRQKEEKELKKKNEELEALTEELTESSERLQQNNEKLAEQEAYLKSIFKAAPVGIGVVVNRYIVFVNDNITRITGYIKEELLGKNALMLYPSQEEYDYVGRVKYEQIARKGLGAVETKWKCKDGTIIDILLSSCPFDPNHLEKGITFTALDITNRKSAERKLKEEKDYSLALAETSPVGILSMDKNGIIQFVNPRALSILRMSKDKTVGEKYTDFNWRVTNLEGKRLPVSQSPFSRVKKTKKSVFGIQNVFIWPDAKKKYLEINASPLFDDKKAFNGLVVTMEDYTEIKQYINRIKETEEKFSQAFTQGPDCILITRMKDGKIIDVNDQFCITTGYERQEVIGRSTINIKYWENPSDRKKFIKILEDKGKVDNMEVSFRYKNGTIAPYIISSGIFVVDEEKCLISILKDISERKKWEQRLQQAADIFRNIQAGLHIYHLEDINDDKTLRMVSANPASAILTGIPVNDVVGKTLDENFPGLREKGIPRMYAEVVRTQKSKDLDDVYYGDDRVVIGAFSVKAFPLPNNHVGASFENITDRLRALQELKDREAKLLEAQEVARIGYYSLNISTRYWTSSKILDDIFGIDDSYNKNTEGYLNIVHPDFREMVSDHLLNHVIKCKNQFNKEFQMIHQKTKAIRWVHCLGRLLFDENGNPERMVGTIQDITQRKKTETAFLQSEVNFRNLFNTIDEFLIIYNKQGKIISVNQTVVDRLGYSKEETLLMNIRDIHSGDEQKEIQRKLKDIFKGKLSSCKIPLKTKEGNLIPVETRVTRGEWNGKYALYSVSKDISELLLSEEKFNKAFHTAMHAMAISDIKTGKFIEINESFERITGYSKDEILGNTSANIGLFVDPDQRTKVLVRVKKEGYAIGVEVPIKTRTGDIRHGIFSASIIKVHDRDYLLTAMNDITRRVKSEIDLTESNRRITEMLQNVKMAAVMLDLEGNITFINDYLLSLTHWKRKEVLGKSWFEYFIPKEIKLDELFSEKVPNGYFEPYLENEILTKRGERRLIGWNNTSLRDTNGKVIGESSIGEDITEKKKAIEDLNRIFNLSTDLICIVSLEGYFLKVNPAFTKVLGFSEKELTSRPFYSFIYPEDVDSTRKEMADKLKKRQPAITFENRYLCKDGSYKWLNWMAQYLEKESIAFAIGRDVTGQKVAEADLIEAKEKAEKSDKLKSVFLANMSHEIRTPMNGIMGFAELLKDPKKDNDQKVKYADIIWKKSNQLLQIINDLLDISKIEAGQMKVITREISINLVLDNLNDFYRNEVERSGKPIILNLIKPLSNAEAVIITDGSRLEQILTNLLSNALKFTEKGNIEFGYQHKSDQIEFFVRDTGIGIAPENHTVIFDQFRQASESTTQLYGGTGLGLSIAKGLTELLGGKIWVESELGKGAVFYFTLPYHLGIKAPHISKVHQKVKYDWSDKLILIVDDDTTSTELLKESLSFTNVRTIASETGMEAVNMCINNSAIDLVLMDIRLPDMDGHEATKAIKKYRKNLPVIAQTANAMPEDEEKSIQAGCDGFIAKPISQDKLLTMTNKFL